MERRISKTTFWLMVGVAIFFDLIQIILTLLAVGIVADSLITVVAGLTFFLWFKLKGVQFNNSKKILTAGGSFLVEAIPVLNVIPTWTISVILTALGEKIPIVKTATQMASGKTASPTKTIAGKVGPTTGQIRKATGNTVSSIDGVRRAA